MDAITMHNIGAHQTQQGTAAEIQTMLAAMKPQTPKKCTADVAAIDAKLREAARHG